MFNFIDSYLSKITMYRLVLYVLIVLVALAVIFSFLGMLSFKPFDLIFSTLILIAAGWLANTIFAKVFGVPANVESVYITALILALIITPPNVTSSNYFSGLMFLFWAGVLSQACKYILAWRDKHVFNPAAFAVALTAITLNQSASWWIGTSMMLPLVIIGGFLIVKKIQRFDMVLTFLVVALGTIVLTTVGRTSPLQTIERAIIHSPIFFFALIMLTEPLTAPQAKPWRITYGIFVGLLFAPALHIGSLYSTPELALLAGNVFAYAVSPKEKYLLTFQSKEQIGTDIIDFVFRSKYRLKFQPGQYLEWTLGHNHPDTRGNRRYFTIASSPTETGIHLGAKFYDHPSTFKQTLQSLRPGDQILDGQLAGEFTLPKDKSKKLVFIAGGIGITPFRSMLQYLLDKNEQRSIVLFYSNKVDTEVAYADVLVEANEKLGIRTVLTLTDQTKIPADWRGHTGYVNAEMIKQEVPDYRDRTYFISGPHSMVVAFEKTLKDMGVSNTQIKIDFFPGLV